jgi:hypothetical protein
MGCRECKGWLGWAAIAFAVGFPSSAGAAGVNGFVNARDSGESVGYARIALKEKNPPGAILTGAVGNAGGYYSIKGVASGSYILACDALGYATQSKEVTLTEGPDLRVDFDLEVQAFEMAPVEVTAKAEVEERVIQPGLIELPAETLARLPALVENDLIRSLQFLPGVQSASDVSSGLYIRGGGPDQNLILLDQIPLYNPTHAFGFFSTFNADAIKDVALFKGAYPARYGGRLGAVLDVANRDGNREKLTGRGGLSIIASRLTLEGPLGKGSWIVSGRRTHLDPVLAAIRSEDNEVPDYYFYDFNARVNQAPSEDDQLSASVYVGRDDLHLDLDRGSFLDVRWGNAAGTLKWTHLFRPGLFGNFLLAGSRYDNRSTFQIFETPIEFTNLVTDLSAKADVDWRVGRDHAVNVGLLASHFSFEYTSEFNRTKPPGYDERPTSVSLYAEDSWQVEPSTILKPGLRAEYFSEGDRVWLEPRVSVSRAVSPVIRFKAGGGLYTQHLQLISTEGFSGADLWAPTDGSADPGRSWQLVTGLEATPSTTYRVSAETYVTGLRNLVQLDNARSGDAEGQSTEDLFRTGGKGWAAGLELFAERRLGPLTGWIGYTLGWSRRTFEEINGGREFPPKYDRRHDLKIVAELDRSRWRYGLNFTYATGQAFTPAGGRFAIEEPASGQPDQGAVLFADKNSARLLPFHRLDVSVARKGHLFGARAEWVLQIFNLYNRRNEWFVTYDTDSVVADAEVTRQLPILPTVGVNLEF